MHLITIDKDKTIVPNNKIVYYLNPDFIYVPTIQKNMLVKQNEFIYKNQIITKDLGASSISGNAFGIKKCNVLGNIKNTVVIANDFRELEKESKARKREVTIANILKVLEFSDKSLFNKFKSNKIYDEIVISAIDDNPYVYNKVFRLKEHISDVLNLLENLALLYSSKSNYLVVKNTDAFVINECLNTIGSYPSITLTLVNDEYLLGREEFLKEKLNLKKRVLYLDVEELLKLNDLLNNTLSTTKLITISGNAIKESKVIRLKKYTILKDVLDKFIDINCNNYKIIVNGLMTGFEVNYNDDFVIDDNVFAINIMRSENSFSSKCIRCGKCIDICPKGVNPLSLENKKKCIDCGLCSYICPSKINLRKKLKGE